MKKLLLIIPIAFLLNSCSQVDGVNPSENKALNQLTGRKDKKPGAMQKALDNWLQNEWNPATSDLDAPTADTKVKVIPNKDGSAKLVDVKSGETLKEMTKEQVKRQEEVKTKYKDEDRDFTLQEYIDKMAVYNETHPSDEENSHVKKVDSMPVIGTRKR